MLFRSLTQEDDVADRSGADPKHAEGEPVAETVCAPRYGQRDHSSDHEHWDAAHLCCLGSVAEIANDGRREEAGGVARVDDAEIHDHAAVHFPISEDASASWAIKAVHFCVCHVCTQASDQKSSLVFVEELGRLGPVRNQPFRGDGYTASDDAFAVDVSVWLLIQDGMATNSHNKNPSPATVAAQTIQVSNSVSKQTTEGSGQDSAAEEQVQAPLKFITLVIHRDEVDTPREESSFKESE